MLYVCSLTPKEEHELKNIARKAKDRAFARRAQVILASGSRTPVKQILQMTGYSYRQARKIIHIFNKGGLEGIVPRRGGGRPPIFTDDERKTVVELAESHPKDLGYPLSQWSLAKLQLVLIKKKKLAYISRPTIRVILQKAGLSYQRTKTWKHSNDPRFGKKNKL